MSKDEATLKTLRTLLDIVETLAARAPDDPTTDAIRGDIAECRADLAGSYELDVDPASL